MKRMILLMLVSTTWWSCSPMKMPEMREIGVKNRSLVIFFSREVNEPIDVIIDRKSVPIVAPAEGTRLEIYNLETMRHRMEIRSNHYIVSKPLRYVDFDPEKGQVVEIVALIPYADETAPAPEREEAGIFRRFWNRLTFWNKETGESERIDTQSVYGEFTD